MDSERVQEYEGGRMRRPRSKIVLKPKKPKVNKQALLRKRLMKHFGGFFNEMQEAPPMSPPSMSPQDGGRRRRSKSPMRKAPVRRRAKKLGGEGEAGLVHKMMDWSNNNILQPSGATRILEAAGNAPGQSYDLGVNTLGKVGNLFSGGRKRRSSSPKRRVVPTRRAALPKRHVVPKRRAARPTMRSMFN